MRRRIVTITFVLMAMAVAVAGPVAPTAEAATGTATVSGAVRVDFGTFTSGIYGLPVRLVDAATNVLVAKRTTVDQGAFTFTDIPAGTYLVEFLDTDHFWQTQWYQGALGRGTATPIVVADGATVSGIDALLPPVGGVIGTVTSGGTGRPGIDVRIYEAPSGRFVAKTVTGAAGTYSLLDLPLGTYHVRFSDASGAFALQWFGGSSTEAGAAAVTVNRFSNTTADVSLGAAGTISGTVTGSGSGLAGVSVRIYPINGGARVAKVYTGADGSFAVTVPVGTYGVQLGDVGSPWIQQWYDGAAAFGQATPVVVSGGATTAIHGVLVPA